MRGWRIVGGVGGLEPPGGVVGCHSSDVIRKAVGMVIV